MHREDYIATHSLFYRNNYRRLFTIAFVLITLIIMLLALNFYQYKSRPAIKFFATTSNGQLIEINPQ